MLISRFLINLRRAYRPNEPTEAAQISTFSAANFRVPTIASVVGNMDQPLDLDHISHDDDDEFQADQVGENLLYASDDNVSSGTNRNIAVRLSLLLP